MIIILSLLLNDVLEVIVIEDITRVHVLLLILLSAHLSPQTLPLAVLLLLASCSDE
jgi:hypothetical protein